MKNLRYEKLLAKWGVNKLEDRRVRGSLIEMYNYVNVLDEINSKKNPMVNTPKLGFLT